MESKYQSIVLPQTTVSKINLLIIRDTFSEKSTVGELFLNGERMCDTLENPYINNERSISCIPEGEYKVRLEQQENQQQENTCTF